MSLTSHNWAPYDKFFKRQIHLTIHKFRFVFILSYMRTYPESECRSQCTLCPAVYIQRVGTQVTP
jgi:hypothetical protein